MDKRKSKKIELKVEFLQLQSKYQRLKQVPREQRFKNHAANIKSLYKRMSVLKKSLPDGDLLSSKSACQKMPYLPVCHKMPQR